MIGRAVFLLAGIGSAIFFAVDHGIVGAMFIGFIFWLLAGLAH